jgi:hypothetical protein
MTTPDPAAQQIQETRELLVWGAIPAVVGGVGLIIDGIYVMVQYGAFAAPSFGPTGARAASLVGATSYFTNPIANGMIAVGLVTLVLLGLSRFGKRRLAIIGSIALLVYALALLAYLIYALVVSADTTIYSLVLALLIMCVAVAGVSGLMAQRLVVIK